MSTTASSRPVPEPPCGQAELGPAGRQPGQAAGLSLVAMLPAVLFGQLTQRVPNSAGVLDADAKSVTVPSQIGRFRPVITVPQQRVRPQLQAVR